MVTGKASKFAEFRRIWRPDLGSAGAPEWNFQRCFLQLSFLRRHGASSLAAVNTFFWNPAISGNVSRSAEFGCDQAYGVCTAGAPKRVEQGFGAPSLQSLHQVCKVCIWHTKGTLCNQLVETNAYFMQTMQTLGEDFKYAH